MLYTRGEWESAALADWEQQPGAAVTFQGRPYRRDTHTRAPTHVAHVAAPELGSTRQPAAKGAEVVATARAAKEPRRGRSAGVLSLTASTRERSADPRAVDLAPGPLAPPRGNVEPASGALPRLRWRRARSTMRRGRSELVLDVGSGAQGSRPSFRPWRAIFARSLASRRSPFALMAASRAALRWSAALCAAALAGSL